MAEQALSEGRVGSLIAGKYQLKQLLGSGGMGAVYEAVHQFTQRRVAVKLMHPSFARSGIAAERFLREAQAPSTIGHPGIVEVLDGGRDRDGSLYLVLELLEGETLSAAIKQGPMRAERIAGIALELLGALEAAHQAGFVHRDIKPENVFLLPTDTDEPLVKLLDFGVAGVLSEEESPGLTIAGAVLGTPLYMSPEQALGKKVDGRSDLWSVGAVLYQALTGKPPFSGNNFQALVVSIATQAHLPLTALRPDLPVRFVAVIERALQKELPQRWASAQEMATALTQALSHGRRDRIVPAPEGQGPAAAQPKPKGHPGIGLSFLLALLVLGGLVWRWSRADNRSASESVAPVPIASARIDPPERRAQATAQNTLASDRPLPPIAQAEPTNTVSPLAEKAAPTPKPARGLDPSALSDALKAHESELQRCYQETVIAELLQEPSTAAQLGPTRLDVTFEVSALGRVERLRVAGAASAKLRTCVTSAIDRWRFPQSDATTELTFPVIFQPNVVQ